MSNYCLPIIKSTQKEVLQEILANQLAYRYFEVWLDYINDLEDKFIHDLTQKWSDQLLFLFRRQRLEQVQMPTERRQELVKTLSTRPVYVDLDIATQMHDISWVQSQHLPIRLITSYHNYDYTPEAEQLIKTLQTMERFQPTIYKLATFCKTEHDALVLLSVLLELKRQQKKYIVLGMGEHGLITRVFGTLWGNELTFAPQTLATQSAPGQLTREQMERIFGEMKF